MSLVALVLMAIQGATAQPGTVAPQPVPLAIAPIVESEPGSSLTVHLLTIGPGDQVWEKFGHNAIWIHDSANRTDIAYHWGLFDFAASDFVPRLIQGRMRYSMGAFDLEETVDAYRQANRTVWAQEINLTPAQRKKLADFIAWNLLPENRFYSYDYYRDNCSTRVRDALDTAAGDAIRAASGTVPSGTTYRFHTSRLTQDDWPVFTGTMMALGQPTDEPVTAWEEMFLPVRMMKRLEDMRVRTADGEEPFVREARVLHQATRLPEETDVNRGLSGYLGIAAGMLALGTGLLVLRRRERGGAGVLALAAVWSVAAGLAGVLIAFLWAFTDHVYSYRNENLFHLNPLSLVLAALLVRAIWKRRHSAGDDAESARREAFWMAAIVAGLSATGFLIQILPGMDQVNAPVIALALPLHLAVAGCIAALATGPEPSAS